MSLSFFGKRQAFHNKNWILEYIQLNCLWKVLPFEQFPISVLCGKLPCTCVQQVQWLVIVSVTPGRWLTYHVNFSLNLSGLLSVLKFKNVQIRGLSLKNPFLFSVELHLGQANCQEKTHPAVNEKDSKTGLVKPFRKRLKKYEGSCCHCNIQNGCKLMFFSWK